MNTSKADLDNHSNQLNPNNDAYWQSRSYDERPDNWDEDEDDSSSNSTVSSYDDYDDTWDDDAYEPFGDSGDYD